MSSNLPPLLADQRAEARLKKTVKEWSRDFKVMLAGYFGVELEDVTISLHVHNVPLTTYKQLHALTEDEHRIIVKQLTPELAVYTVRGPILIEPIGGE